MHGLVFAKYEGLGNDFIVVDLERPGQLDARTVSRLCDRHLGVGADGVLLVLPPSSPTATARMVVINADGSVPEMCGNGLRCVALHVAAGRGAGDVEFTVETDSGPRACTVAHGGPGEARVRVEMGVVRVLEARRELLVGGKTVDLAIVDAGNPHAVTFRPDPTAEIDTLGPAIARHPSFPRGTNVELVVLRDQDLDVLVWERGVGRTLACGTGACAVVAVACATGMVRPDTPANVHLPGGVLAVTHDPETGRTLLEGPARLVFRGEISTLSILSP